MRKAALIVFLAIILFIPQNTQAYAEYELIFDLDPLEFDFIVLGPMGWRDRVIIRLSCYDAHYIDFLICDQQNFNAWIEGLSNWAYLHEKHISGLYFEFEIYSYGYYYFLVFNNDTRLPSSGVLDAEYFPYEPLNPLLIVGVGFSIVCIIGVGAYLIHRRRKHKSLST